MLGHDWYQVFYRGVLHMYPPWMVPLFQPFRLVNWRWSFAFVNSLTLVGIASIAAWQSEKVIWDGLKAALMALVNPVLWYLLWNGQIDGLVLISMLALPWCIPVLLLRPQIFGLVLAIRKKWLFGMIFWLLLSFLIWGFWIQRSLNMSDGSIAHPTAMGWATLGWPIGLVGIVLLLMSGGHFWKSFAAAFLASPYLQPYNMILLFPVLGRLSGWRRLMLWGWIWIVGVVPGIVGWTRYIALGFPLAAWWLLRDDDQKGFLP